MTTAKKTAPDPIGAALVAKRRRATFRCAVCGKEFEGVVNAGSKYPGSPTPERTCSPKCRYQLYLKRHGPRQRRTAGGDEEG